jgi:glycosyltransferase involved in cell wall biosynthesis
MRVLIADGERRLRATGYGGLSRAIILALKRHTDIDLRVEKASGAWDVGIPDVEELSSIKVRERGESVDCVLRVGTPSSVSKFGAPTIVYTQNALGDLPPEWVRDLRTADAIVVPGEFDAVVFRRYFPRVYTCPQYVDVSIFRPMPKYRADGRIATSFLFVGSYSYRKGVDLLLEAFRSAFTNRDSTVGLHLHCFSGLEKSGVNHLLEHARKLPNNVQLTAYSGSVSPQWMARIYNMHDVIVSFSRGEGWCMPLHEALLCGKPVIAADSTAMGEMLPLSGVRRVRVHEQDISQISSPFGSSMRSRYGQAGNVCWEVDGGDAEVALLELVERLDEWTLAASQGGGEVRRGFTLHRMAEELAGAINDVAGEAAGPVRTRSDANQVRRSETFDVVRSRLLKDRRFTEADELERLEIAKRPNVANLYIKAAWTRAALGRDADALEALLTATRLEPTISAYRRELAKLYMKLGEETNSVQELEIAERIDSGEYRS